MKKPNARIAMALVVSAVALLAHGQGQNMFQSDGSGNQYLLNPAPPAFPFAPRSVHIGTLPIGGFAAFRVRGDQLLSPSIMDQFNAGSVCTFRTDVSSGNSQNWSMVSGALEIGRLFHFNPNNSFNLQARQQNGALWLRNSANGAIRLAFDGNGSGGTFTVNGFVHNPIGYGQVGSITPGIGTFNPWARWSLMHQNMGTVAQQTAIQGCFRPWFGNAVLGMGNADLFYFGHKYQLLNGTGAEQNDNSDVVAAWGEPNLPAGLGHQFDTFQFRYIAATDATTSAGSVNGLELMRLRPFRAAAGDPVQGFVGVGDWSNSTPAAMPEERLDVLDRTMRLRGLPTATYQLTAGDWDRLMVVTTDGTVQWRSATTLGTGGTDCKWDWDPPSGRIYTAWVPNGTNGTCPESDWRVGIGTPTLPAKLNVESHNTLNGGSASAALIGKHFTPDGGAGISGSVDPEIPGGTLTLDATGVYGTVNNLGKSGNGTRGDVFVKGSSTTEANGAFGFVTLLSGSNTDNAYGVRANVVSGEGSGATNVFGSWAKVEGTVNVTNTLTAVLGLAKPAGGSTPALVGGDFFADFTSINGTSNSTGVSAWSKTFSSTTVLNSIGLDAGATAGIQTTIGVKSAASGPANAVVTGVHGETTGPALFSKGVFGYANTASTGSTALRFGVYGKVASGSSNDPAWLATTNASILGDFPGYGAQHWAGFFEGNVGMVGNFFANQASIISDGSLKTDVQPISDQQNASLMNVQSHVYQFTEEAKERLRLPEGEQIGFIAQEVEEIFPQLVSPYTVMARFDSLGNVTAPEMELKAVNYNGFVPLLVGGHQQQETRLAAIEGQLAQALEQLAACCVASDGTRALTGGTTAGTALENDLRIVPNPVADRTELRYTLANEGRVRLEITDASSRIVLAREEAERSSGSYVYEWETTLLAPGTYFCTLYINDELN